MHNPTLAPFPGNIKLSPEKLKLSHLIGSAAQVKNRYFPLGLP